jgi:hypothetical protein
MRMARVATADATATVRSTEGNSSSKSVCVAVSVLRLVFGFETAELALERFCDARDILGARTGREVTWRRLLQVRNGQFESGCLLARPLARGLVF